MATFNFGAKGETGLAAGTYGYLQSFDKNQQGDISEDKDEDGNVALVDAKNKNTEIQAEYVYDSETAAPEFGDIITVGTLGYIVSNVGTSETNEGRTRLKLTLKHYDENNLPAAV
jgi:hypothetical protein